MYSLFLCCRSKQPDSVGRNGKRGGIDVLDTLDTLDSLDILDALDVLLEYTNKSVLFMKKGKFNISHHVMEADLDLKKLDS